MTPEERAAKIVDNIACDADFYCDGRVSNPAAKEAMDDAKSAIASAIRNAVNDALERAAVVAAEEYSPNKFIGVCEGIRALKVTVTSS